MKKDIHSKIIVALTQPKAGRVRFIKDVVSSRHLKDIKYVEMLVNSLSDKSAVFADFMADEVIWQLGLDMMSLLVGDFNEQKEAVKYRRLRVIKRFDKLEAKTLARENVYSRHYGLPLEGIALLSGSIEDAELLIELAKSKPEERVIAAFTSLRGIENEDVIDFLSHCLKTGVGFPELTLSYFHVPTLSNVIKVNLTSLLEKLEKGPCLSSSDARHLILLLRASAGQNLTKFDTVFIRATKLALCDIPIPEDYYLFQLDFMEATFEAVVSNPASESQKLLIKERCFLEI